MGCVDTIRADSFPQQGKYLNKRVEACFHFQSDDTILGTVRRDDMERPFRTIIELDDGRFIDGSECQWRIAEKGANP